MIIKYIFNIYIYTKPLTTNIYTRFLSRWEHADVFLTDVNDNDNNNKKKVTLRRFQHEHV